MVYDSVAIMQHHCCKFFMANSLNLAYADNDYGEVTEKEDEEEEETVVVRMVVGFH